MERKDPVTRLDHFNFDSIIITLMVAVLVCWGGGPCNKDTLTPPLEMGFTLSDATLWK